MSAAVAAACGGSSGPAPSPGPGGGNTIRGSERIGWDQQATNAGELNRHRYRIYVDGTRFDLADVLCASTSGESGFACSGRLPSMTPGSHTLELSALVDDVESSRSAPLQVVVSAGVIAPGDVSSTEPAGAPTPDDDAAVSRALPVAFTNVADLAVIPDGLLLVAERAGAIHVVGLDDGRVQSSLVIEGTQQAGDDGTLLSVALDPTYPRTRTIYALHTAPAGGGELIFRITRYRAAGDVFGERAVVVETGRADAAQTSGTLRFGPDGRLYAALFEAGTPGASRGELRGRVLRFNPDGTTPADQPSGTPLYTASEREPRGLDWHPANGRLWLAQDGGVGPARIVSVGRDRRSARAGLVESEDSLAPVSGVSTIRFYAGDRHPELQGTLLVSGESGLYAIRLDAAGGSRIRSIDRLVDTPVRGISIANDGTVFVATPESVLRLETR
jgi:glucose/arabinose dehydrogenase